MNKKINKYREMKITETKVFFWAGPLSNWVKVKDGILIPAELSIDGNEFRLPTSEHIFMYLKATLFRDREMAEKIIEAPSPRIAKSYGRKVRGFQEDIWRKHREEAMMTAVRLRFDSDPKFREYLCQDRFKGKEFVEANPYDYVWSCGYLEDDPRCESPEIWPGLNLLGKILTKIRDNHE